MSTSALCFPDLSVTVNATDTLANIISIIEIPAPANQPLIVTGIDMTFDGTTASNKPVLVQLIRASATGTFPSSSVTPDVENTDPASYTTLITAANVKYGTATAEGAVASTNGLRLYRLPPTAGVLYQLPLGRGLWVPKAGFLRVRAVATAAVNVTVNVTVDEGGQ